MVVPTEKVEPETRLLVKVGVEQLSEAVTAGQFTTIPQDDDGASTVILEGQLAMMGSMSSTIVTSKLQVIEFPASSVAVSVNNVVPVPVNSVPTAGD